MKTYASSWPGLSPAYFFQADRSEKPPFPLSAPRKLFFYRARNAIYHLFRALGRFYDGETVLVPAYHSGSEVWAIRAAGAFVRYYHINRNLEPDLDELEKLFGSNPRPRALLVIHFLGWPQPVTELRRLCRKWDVTMVEDCALSLLSETGGQPLGTFGDYAVFCLYKTLPLPNGGLLIQNRNVLDKLARLSLDPCGRASVAGRSAELMVEWLRGRSDATGKTLLVMKRATGRTLSALGVKRLPVGDIGFDPAQVNVGMSSLCDNLLKRFDYAEIRRKRRANFLLMRQRLAGRAALLPKELGEGTCPLFFPILVPDKPAAALALRRRGIDAVEFWNYGDAGATRAAFPDAWFLRDHLLELPIHQEITPAQVDYIADQVLSLKLHYEAT